MMMAFDVYVFYGVTILLSVAGEKLLKKYVFFLHKLYRI